VFAPDKLVAREAFGQQVARLAAWLRGSPPQAGGSAIHLPGEPERATARERNRDGIPLPRTTRDALAACARSVGVDAFERAFA
jgi:LDH2 family malate/lactate/ureidoglycolate dehydrogenase